MRSGHIDRRRELLAAWERRSRARGGTEHSSGADALFLVTALSNALRRASETPELGRAARTWGARFGAPVDALASLSVLRDALTGVAGDSADGLPVPLPVLNRIFDQAALEAVDAASANLRSEARNDPLTGCANRRALDEELAHAMSSARRSNLDLAVAVVDLDGLKLINDTQGHAAGDAALVDLVGALRQALREADTLYRTGGDEFVVVAPFTDAAGARALMRRAERMGGPTFSWGVASLTGLALAVGAVTAETTVLMDAADADLYDRRRATRRATAMAARRRTATVVASVAASVAVTASMAGLAVALDTGADAPSSSGATAAAGVRGAPGGPHWPTSAVGRRGAQRSSSRGGLALGGPGSPGTSVVGLLGTVGPAAPSPVTAQPAVLAGPASGSSGVVAATLPTLVVRSSGPVALASAAGPTSSSGTSSKGGHGQGAGQKASGGNGNGGRINRTAGSHRGPTGLAASARR